MYDTITSQQAEAFRKQLMSSVEEIWAGDGELGQLPGYVGLIKIVQGFCDGCSIGDAKQVVDIAVSEKIDDFRAMGYTVKDNGLLIPPK
jgi:hypothetical protein